MFISRTNQWVLSPYPVRALWIFLKRFLREFQVYVTIAAGILFEVILVVALGGVERACGADLGDDRLVVGAGDVETSHHGERDFPLLCADGKDGRTVLASDIVALAVFRRRVVHAEKVQEQFPVADDRGIERNADGFRVSGFTGTDFFVRWPRGDAA